MERILLATDGSKAAVRAARKLVDMLPSLRKAPEIRLVNVREPIPLGGVYVTAISHDVAKSYYENEGEAALAPSIKVLEDAGVPYSAKVLVGDVATILARYAASERCDMIYLGTRGMTAISNLVLGSVATKLLHLADVPVVLVRSTAETPTEDKSEVAACAA